MQNIQNISATPVPTNMVVSACTELTIENLSLYYHHLFGILCFSLSRNIYYVYIWMVFELSWGFHQANT